MPQSPMHQAPEQTPTPLTQALQDVLSGTYSLFLATHNYHWNVEGRNFLSLHAQFEVQYVELFAAIDVIAERIRALGDYVLPFEGESAVQSLKMLSISEDKTMNSDVRADQMIGNLIELTESVAKTCQLAKEEAQEAEDDESESLMIERIAVHQKSLWLMHSVQR